MARDGYFILDSDLHLMEPYDLWERYLEGPHKANPPHCFAAHRHPDEEIKVVGKLLWYQSHCSNRLTIFIQEKPANAGLSKLFYRHR